MNIKAVVENNAIVSRIICDGAIEGRELVEDTPMGWIRDGEGMPFYDPHPPSLDDKKVEMIALINRAREADLLCHVEYDGRRYQVDSRSLQNITGAAMMVMLDPDYTTYWITADNEIVSLSAADLIALGKAAADKRAAIYADAALKKQRVRLAVSQAELDAIYPG